MPAKQGILFDLGEAQGKKASSSTFVKNMSMPMHRWFRYSAGFSAAWVRELLDRESRKRRCQVLDPFTGSGTVLLEAERRGLESIGIEAHPFVARVAQAKLQWRRDPDAFYRSASEVGHRARNLPALKPEYPPLIGKCYSVESLDRLDRLRRAVAEQVGSPESPLLWLSLVSILRECSPVGTANWQYVLPRKSKAHSSDPYEAFERKILQIRDDMRQRQAEMTGAPAALVVGDARSCSGVEDEWADLVVTSPPYSNNFDYADATRLEMTFMGEVQTWGDLQHAVRRHLVRSCSQHVPDKTVDLEKTLASPSLKPIAAELATVCRELAEVRLSKGGKKTYHLMIGCYFLDMATVWQALRRCCRSPSKVCFVLGDSAPYGVHVPVMEWTGRLAVANGFKSFHFEQTRERNRKWKNRKHRVPLCEGRLWIEG